MRIVIDSHVLIWSTVEPERLSHRARRVLASHGGELLFSMVSLWELTIKIANGKLTALGSSIRDVTGVLRDRGVEILPIHSRHLERLEVLPRHHGDPFDRLLIAQAMEDQLTLMTDDRLFHQYPVSILW